MADEENAPTSEEAASPASVAAPAEEGGESPKKSGLKVNKILIGLGLQLVVLLTAVAFLINGVFNQPKTRLTRAKLEQRVVASVEENEKDFRDYDLGEIIVNTSPTTTMRTRISIEVTNEEVSKMLKRRDLMIRARALSVISQFPKEQLKKVHGKLQLKDKLVEAFVDELEKGEFKGDGTVRNVYFLDIIQM